MFKYRTNECEDEFVKRTKSLVCYLDVKIILRILCVSKPVGMSYKDISIFLN